MRHKSGFVPVLKIIILSLLLLLAACNSKNRKAESYSADKFSAPASSPAAFPTSEMSDVLEENVATAEKVVRKIHYDGHAELYVTNKRVVFKKIVDLANGQKGYVERIDSNEIVVQVPVKSFEAVFAKILTFGKVKSKEITSLDITDAYYSAELRLKIARTTRERLLKLLKKAKDEDDKLLLLEQIEKITATIQLLESQFELLKTRVSYSTITVWLESRKIFGDRGSFEPLGFNWINELSPQNESVASAGKKAVFSVPEGMLSVKANEGYWSAESGDKVLFRASKWANEPRGEKDFWIMAVKLRLTPGYKSVEQISVGEFDLLRLISYDDVPQIYYVGLKVKAGLLTLVELVFPNMILEEDYKASIFKSIRKGEK